MENRTFLGPNVRFDSKIEFCSPSWVRTRKYVSWHHWLATKSAHGPARSADRTLRYKLYEIGHYAGSVILEIGLTGVAEIGLPIRAAKLADRESQYFAVDTDANSIVQAAGILRLLRLETSAVLFQGTLSEFRGVIPVTPTMVLVNDPLTAEAVLGHLALFLEPGTPVLLTDWFASRSDQRADPDIGGFECYGRFGENVLLISNAEIVESPVAFSKSQFHELQRRFCVLPDGQLVQNHSEGRKTANQGSVPVQGSGKQWPLTKNTIDYPPTLPDKRPWPRISMVIPTFDHGRDFGQTMNSIINQDYPNLETIVVNFDTFIESESGPGCFRNSIDHLISAPAAGRSEAINAGMKVATGDLVKWLNPGDMLAAGSLFAFAMAFWKSNADIVVGTVQVLDGGKIAMERLTSCDNGPLQLADLLDLENHWLSGRFFDQPEMMFTRALWERAGGHVDRNLKIGLAYELCLRFSIAGANLYVIGRPTAICRQRDDLEFQTANPLELKTVNRRYIEKYGVPKPASTRLYPKKYRVAFVNDAGPRFGAGIAHRRLRDCVDAAGHESILVCARPTDATSKTSARVFAEIEAFNPDLVVFGILHNAGLGMDLVDQVSDRWATAMVLHDLWATTGGCCYSGNSVKHLTSFDPDCPSPEHYPALQPEQIDLLLGQKLAAGSKPRRVVLMANSQWTRQQAESSAIGNRGVVNALKYGFPTHLFKPRDKGLSREILGLPQDRFIVLFSAVDVLEERKGLRHLFEALNRLQLDDLLPVCMGHVNDKSALPPGTLPMGYIDDPWRAALIYAAADIFVGPSLQESFGQVFIEAAACGTPSIGYRTCGVQESIRDGVTGLHASHVHPSALATAIHRLYRDPVYRQQLGVWGRIEIENEWSLRSAYHHFNNLLRQIPSQIGFLPPVRTQFLPEKSGGQEPDSGCTFGLLQRGENNVLLESGFGAPERFQLPDSSTPRVQWAVDRVARLRVHIVEPGSFNVRLQCLNPCRDQAINVWCDDKHVNTIHPEYGRCPDLQTIQLVSDLAPGDHHLRLEFSRSHVEPERQRRLFLLIVSVKIDPSSAADSNRVLAAAA